MKKKKDKQAILIKVNGERSLITLHTDESNTQLNDLQKAVGGMIELIRFKLGDMYVNETGKLDLLPVNAYATLLVWPEPDIDKGLFIVGDVVLMLNARNKHLLKSENYPPNYVHLVFNTLMFAKGHTNPKINQWIDQLV